MAVTDPFEVLKPGARRVADQLIARRETLAVCESSAGGLISAALLSLPGASAYFLGGAVIYTGEARQALLGVDQVMMQGMRSATEPMAQLMARTVRGKVGAVWGLAETGATGPSGNRYGDAAGHCCVAVSGPHELSRVLETGMTERSANMMTFAEAALALLEQAIDAAGRGQRGQ